MEDENPESPAEGPDDGSNNLAENMEQTLKAIAEISAEKAEEKVDAVLASEFGFKPDEIKSLFKDLDDKTKKLQTFVEDLKAKVFEFDKFTESEFPELETVSDAPITEVEQNALDELVAAGIRAENRSKELNRQKLLDTLEKDQSSLPEEDRVNQKDIDEAMDDLANMDFPPDEYDEKD